MAEDQGFNGDEWNSYAIKLLSLFGWDFIGDTNMDLPGEDNKKYGVDALMCYESPEMLPKQVCVIESKNYSKESLSKNNISKWIDRLHKKLDMFYQSEQLVNDFPELKDYSNINLGIIMCWIKNPENDSFFEDKFKKDYLLQIKTNTTPKQDAYKRIIVITNDRIIRLCSVAEILSRNDYRFIYPSQLIDGRPLVRSKVLSIEYLMSNIILSEIKKNDNWEKTIFYFGPMNEICFKVLYETLNYYQILEQGRNVYIYYFNSDEEFRKHEKNIIKTFKGVITKFKKLSHFNINNVPTIISDNNE